MPISPALRNTRRLIRASAIYDVLATAPLATPWSFGLLHQFLGQFAPLPEFQPMHLLFVHLLASLVLVWAGLRLWRPVPAFGAADALARGLFFFWQIYFLLAGASPVLWVFAFFEAGFGIAQAWAYWRLSSREREFPKLETQ